MNKNRWFKCLINDIENENERMVIVAKSGVRKQNAKQAMWCKPPQNNDNLIKLFK